METLIHADIFFFITSVAVLLITGFLVVILIYVVGVARNVRHIVERVREESDKIMTDVGEFREKVKKQGMHFSDVLDFAHFIKSLRRKSDKPAKRRTIIRKRKKADSDSGS